MRLLPSSLGVLRMGDWELVLELSGGLYLARRTGPRRFARLGTLRLLGVADGADDPFSREVARASAAAHPLLCSIQDVGDLAGQRFVVTDYVEGGSLQELVPRGGTLPLSIALSIAVDALAALDAVHQARDKTGRRLTHGAITKAAVVVGIDGRARLSDVGLAWLGKTQGDPLGVARYASPAVRRGEEPLEIDDVYAMGRILHEVLSGIEPGDPSEALPLLSSLDARIPPAVAGAVARATAPDPEHRYRSADAFAAALEAASPRATPREVGVFLESSHDRALAERRAAVATWSASRSEALGYRPPPRSRVLLVRLRRQVRRHRRVARAATFVGLALLGVALGLTAWRIGRGPSSLEPEGAATEPTAQPAQRGEPAAVPSTTATAAAIDIEALPTVEGGDDKKKPARRRSPPVEELSNPYR